MISQSVVRNKRSLDPMPNIICHRKIAPRLEDLTSYSQMTNALPTELSRQTLKIDLISKENNFIKRTSNFIIHTS
jgi:hypothetical protein